MDKELYADLVSPETVPRMDGKMQLESKQDMKRRKLPSPNRADALALSFAFPVLKKQAGGFAIPIARRTPCAATILLRGLTDDSLVTR